MLSHAPCEFTNVVNLSQKLIIYSEPDEARKAYIFFALFLGTFDFLDDFMLSP